MEATALKAAPMHHPDYKHINQRFRRQTEWRTGEPLQFPDEGIDLYYRSFTSRNARHLLGRPSYRCEEHDLCFPGETTQQVPTDAAVEENIHFRYPLVREHGAVTPLRRHTRVVILLHGLNERSFTKYVPWAYHIWKSSGTPVILFPLTFHINRVLRAWGHQQRETFACRRELEGNENTHLFNAVISDRLGEHPERFFWGALQSYWDIVDLVRNIRNDSDPHFTPDARVDLFGFSAGGYVALALLLEDCERLFAESRGVLFASCASVRDTNLTSCLIVDLMAEIALMKLYVKYRDRLSSPRLKHWLGDHPEGQWFSSFCGLIPDRTRLDARLKGLSPRVFGIANSNDQVIPPGAMLNALQGIRRDTGIRVTELPLGIHENPFAFQDYNVRDRSLVTEFFDEARYGSLFERFIDDIVGHFAGRGRGNS